MSLSVLTMCFNTHRTWPCTINQNVFPLQGLTWYPISLCPNTLSGMSVLFGIIFCESLLMENHWVSTKTNSDCNQSESQDWRACRDRIQTNPEAVFVQLGFCMQWAQTAVIKKCANVRQNNLKPRTLLLLYKTPFFYTVLSLFISDPFAV